MIYILLALFFCYTFLKYISQLVFSVSVTKKISVVGVIPLVVYLFAAPFCDFEYIKGNVTFTLTVLSTYLSIEYDANGNNYRMSIDIDTGVKNKKAYKEDINKINKKYFQEESPVEKITFVLFDIDNMKGINEKQGLVTGDEMITMLR